MNVREYVIKPWKIARRHAHERQANQQTKDQVIEQIEEEVFVQQVDVVHFASEENNEHKRVDYKTNGSRWRQDKYDGEIDERRRTHHRVETLTLIGLQQKVEL